ncbi:hypothetical protein JG687_00003954 [Phytophthora cactorum]|uniref:SCP2 domain-containing protein n=1 Tax=Phytophthora cactorum TaxID=29920 RepID=A0A8T1UR45_9STRA|nr:hypothetical protein JG687_00003954 [Phytophthora cactorum]
MSPRAAELFDMMSGAVDEVGPSLVSKVKGVIKFDVSGAGAWLVDLKNGKGSVKPATASDKADLTISLSEENFLKMMDNKLNPQQAFMKGLVKIKGNMGLAMKLNVKVKGIIQFDITGAGKWNLDLKSATPALTEGVKKADVTITVKDADFVAIAMGKLNAQQAFMKGKLKLKGNMTLAMKLPVVFNALKPQSKL